MYNPVSTYRIQFNKEFTFQDLARQIPYFQQLGVKAIYASPIFKAVPGSMHGYDVVNPYEINPEIGTESELRELIQTLQAEGIGWIQDIVPNHMAFHHSNLWLMDVLEKGSLSVYAQVFDVPASTDFFSDRLMVPFLGNALEDVIANGELQLVSKDDGLFLSYADQYYPLNSRSYKSVLDHEETKSMDSVRQFLLQLDGIHSIADPVQYALSSHELKLQFKGLLNELETRSYIQKNIAAINDQPEALKEIVDQQFYRLCSWKETTNRINYRRFFTVSSLICLNMQSEQVFHQYHKLIKAFVDEELFNGIRVDHIDGLYDPETYLKRLRALCGEETYIIVEKILEPNETLKPWPIQGTTGYEFLALCNNLVTRNRSENKFSRFYKTLTRDLKSVEQKIVDKKSLILYQHMGGELQNLYAFLRDQNLVPADVSPDDLREAIGEFLIQCPVYKLYGNSLPLEAEEEKTVKEILKNCRADKPYLANAFVLLENIFIDQPGQGDADFNKRAIAFYMRCMQFSGPLMAKGVEDTLMYTFNRFVAHNEVGDSPGFFGLDADDFHEAMQQRQQHWPLALNATSTHDTKRGEDARMRLNVLTDLADEWIANVTQWIEWNQLYKKKGAPDLNDEYFIYQTLIGSYPCLPVFDSADRHPQPDNDFLSRLEEYFTKAFREAKRYSDWADPDQHYEKAVIDFVTEILKPEHKFLSSFLSFQQKVSDFGVVNSLAQTTLKFTCPGVPDTYQGTTGWDLSLVDPDNRRQVNYEDSVDLLNQVSKLKTTPELVQELWMHRADSRIKLWLMHKLFKTRNAYKDVFQHGQYIPLEVKGKLNDHCLAFARVHKGVWLISVIPLNFARIENLNNFMPDWEDTRIIIPVHAPQNYTNLLFNARGKHSGEMFLRDVLKDFFIGVVELENKKSPRKAGVLLSVASLPSAFGIGDMGREARAFADFLHESNQTIWQLLPINITSEDTAHSPYSSYSSMAGNPLLISPEELVTEGLLTEAEVEQHEIWNNGKIKYRKAETIRHVLLNKAWNNFNTGEFSALKKEFASFRKREVHWLDDFALFEYFRIKFRKAPWYEWPVDIQQRNPQALMNAQQLQGAALDMIKWIQFIFYRQWKNLRTYCNNRNISLLGDIPFYVSYNSTDVWANRELFALDESGRMTGVAGVPPDYFNSDGQLWGMPVFCWDELKKTNYHWWINRVRKNLELFDEVRLDHFRAFVDYWDVPATAQTAKEGSWKTGPGKAFFDVVKKEFGKLPFVAEDLGEINPDVFTLRDELKLPGMKILQFAFDEDQAESIYAPHNFTENFVVYTGTHDNNTTRGWYRKDTTPEDRKRMAEFFHTKVTEKNIAQLMIRLAHGSVAKTVIIPMQDILNLDEKSRMNMPSTNEKNWLWRMKNRISKSVPEELLKLVRLYNR
jgi:malto-oligosyltrehalose synthase/4-alpha-glucanotransferase